MPSWSRQRQLRNVWVCAPPPAAAVLRAAWRNEINEIIQRKRTHTSIKLAVHSIIIEAKIPVDSVQTYFNMRQTGETSEPLTDIKTLNALDKRQRTDVEQIYIMEEHRLNLWAKIRRLKKDLHMTH